MTSAPLSSCPRALGAPRPLGPPVATYQPARVQARFDALAATYDWAAWLSGGLLGRWRAALVAALPTPSGPPRVVDLMAGGAELWPPLRRRFGPGLRVAAVDFSAPMLARAARRRASPALRLHLADALATPLPAGRATAVVCAFGLKTLAPSAYSCLVAEARRLLQPGGTLALVELALPRTGWLRPLFNGYLRALLPVLAWVRPAAAAHAALLRYAAQGPAVAELTAALAQAGFVAVRQRRLWPGCAVLVTARKMA
ncbi:class I SAM-dependent methyltransferase [Hymenobacter caeli]|uniref:Demethylmenaquinone methyltransferase/2-methoxy-6-polyprenyl-1,4-benzoquinol methylase n=1 Tax=Hymenobacter caeli TaxID=2735894 RepID=A0ABX2FQE4_9BACT|nr:class I SAM-dependent methyltransferase [Hymenobacter caeli]NRT19393.1 demethylmenaquinone methyltransferase/2-methoxy-6-polyprenyl-1,4-benzoquinol methylase [Hymenobacter caeli]